MPLSTVGLLAKTATAKLKDGSVLEIRISKDGDGLLWISYSGRIMRQYVGRDTMTRDLWPDSDEKSRIKAQTVQKVAEELFTNESFVKENADAHAKAFKHCTNTLALLIGGFRADLIGEKAQKH